MIRSRIERSKEQCVLKSRSKGTTAKAQLRSRERTAISSQSKYSAITGKRCAGVKNIRGGMNPFLVFSVYDQQSHYLSADTKPDFAESSVSAIAIPSPVYDFPAIAILGRERHMIRSLAEMICKPRHLRLITKLVSAGDFSTAPPM